MNLKFAATFGLIALFIFFVASGITKAQSTVPTDSLFTKIDAVTKKLNMKLLLTKEQSIQINKILIENISETDLVKEKVENDLNEKVRALLTKKQRNKFDILKSNWLDEIFDTSEKK